jgi:hypothetical protein
MCAMWVATVGLASEWSRYLIQRFVQNEGDNRRRLADARAVSVKETL